jgi:tol-pal system protein YbgF
MRKTLLLVAAVLLIASPVAAQNKREMQMMADIRMLQEQNQQLQEALAAITDQLKAINGRFDEQANASRKAFADQGLKVDQFASELRVVREGVSDANVKIGQLSQEVEAVRLSIPQFPPPQPAAPLDPSADPSLLPPASGGAPSTAPAPAAPLPGGPGMSPQRLFDTARADYYAGQWDLCVSGFDTYLRTFPKSELAHEAQWYIGECHSNDGKHQEAVAAYNQVIANYPRSASAANAYYKRGLALERLGQVDRARESFDAVIKNFPDSDAARLAKQNLDRLNRGRPPAGEK